MAKIQVSAIVSYFGPDAAKIRAEVLASHNFQDSSKNCSKARTGFSHGLGDEGLRWAKTRVLKTDTRVSKRAF